MFHIKKFCFCGELRHGAIASGILSIVLAVFYLTFGGILISLGQTQTDDLKGSGMKEYKMKLQIIGISYLISGCVLLLVAAVLLVGVKKEQGRLFIPWLVVVFVRNCFLIASLLYGIISNNLSAVEVIFAVVEIITYFYLLLIVLSYHKKLDSANLLDNPGCKPNYETVDDSKP